MASVIIEAKILVVVVFPCVPAIATLLFMFIKLDKSSALLRIGKPSF